MDPSVIIAGVSLMSNTYFQLQGIKSKKTKILLTISKIKPVKGAVVMKLSVSNTGVNPFSIIDMYLQGKIGNEDHKFYACPIKTVETARNGISCGIVKLYADMISVKFNTEQASLKPFELNAFLQPGQAETGWIIFPANMENLLFSNICLTISGEEEIFTNIT